MIHVVITLIKEKNKTLREIIKKIPLTYIEYYVKRKDKKGLSFFFNLGKMCVSDTPCPWQKYCRMYQKLAFYSKYYS